MGDTEECAKAVANSHIISTLIQHVSLQEETNSVSKILPLAKLKTLLLMSKFYMYIVIIPINI